MKRIPGIFSKKISFAILLFALISLSIGFVAANLRAFAQTGTSTPAACDQAPAEFPIPGAGPIGIATGPDGNLWFTEAAANKIGRITTAGVVTDFAVPTADSNPFFIAAGSDGALWFTEQSGNKIGRITTAGVVTNEFPIPTGGSTPAGIAAGPDGALWFTEVAGNQIGRITTAGVITEFSVPTVSGAPYDIAAGPDGNLWFTEVSSNKIGRITTAGIVTDEFPVPTNGQAEDIAQGSDGAMWFTEFTGNQIGRITIAGSFTEFAIPTAGSQPLGIAAGPDGALWFLERTGNNVGQITTAGAITEFPIPTGGSAPWDIASGPDGALWFTEQASNKIGRICPLATATPVDVSGTWTGTFTGPDTANSGALTLTLIQTGVQVAGSFSFIGNNLTTGSANLSGSVSGNTFTFSSDHFFDSAGCRVQLTNGSAQVTGATMQGTVSGVSQCGDLSAQTEQFSFTLTKQQTPTPTPTPANNSPVALCHDVTVDAGPNCTANASIENGSFDPDSGDTITLGQSPPGPYPLGDTTVTLTATDNHGASSSCTAKVTVVDNTRPAITAPAAVTAHTDLSTSCSTIVSDATLGVATASDNCGGVSIARSGVPAGNVFPVGSTTVTYTATDGNGNHASATQTVTVIDNTPPIISCPADIVVGASLGNNSAVVSYPAPTASDNCGVPVVSCSILSGASFPIGTTTVSCTATDGSSNSASCAFMVTVLTPQGATQQLSNTVNSLVAQGVLSQGNGNALTAKLQAAISSLNNGNASAACNQLQAFINQVQAFINSGKLTPAQGQALIDSANAIKSVLGC